MAAWTAAARQSATLSRLSAYKSVNTTSQGALLIQRRGLAGGGAFYYNQDMWKKIVRAKHGTLNHWCTKVSRASHGVGPWKNISNLWNEFSENTSFRVGNGNNIKFWKDKWLGNSVLMNEYPNLFRLSRDKDSTISKYRENSSWNTLFRRNVNDWELEELLTLLARLEECMLDTQSADRLKWGNSKEGIYSVKAGYTHLHAQNDLINNWPWKLIWRTKLPTKVICFTWIAIREACLTQDNLLKRSFQIPNRCYMCRQAAETTNHLLLHCSVVYDIWCMFYSIFGLSWVMPQSTKEAVEVWSSLKAGKSIKKIWNMIPACIFWVVWAERNRRCFDGLSTSNHALKAKCFLLLFSWCKLSPVNSPELFLDFVSSLEL